jgi:hypothetical protein
MRQGNGAVRPGKVFETGRMIIVFSIKGFLRLGYDGLDIDGWLRRSDPRCKYVSQDFGSNITKLQTLFHERRSKGNNLIVFPSNVSDCIRKRYAILKAVM